MVETVKCKALVAFTRYVSGYGQVHGDPDSKLKAAVTPEVPVEAVTRFVEDGFVAAPKGFLEALEKDATQEADEVAATELAAREAAAAAAAEAGNGPPA